MHLIKSNSNELKKIQTLAFAFMPLVLLTIFGCNKKGANSHQDAQDSSKKQLTVAMVYDQTGPESSFNSSIKSGLDQIEKDFGIKVIHIKSKRASDLESNLLAVAENPDTDLIISAGIFSQTPVETVAKMHIHKKFLYIHSAIDLPNVKSAVFKEEEGSFMAGYLAGLMGKKIGFVGGMDIPVIRKFQCGFFAGVKTANPTAQLFPPKFIGSFEDSEKARAVAAYLYGRGTDIVFSVAGGAGQGVLRAAKDSNKYAIGVDVDQDSVYPKRILTSMIKNSRVIVEQSVKELLSNKFKTGVCTYGVKDNGLVLSEMKYTKDEIGPMKIKKLEEIRQDIIKGNFKIPSTVAELEEFNAVAINKP